MRELTLLEVGETMKQNRRAERLTLDCSVVASVIDDRPGVPSKPAIAGLTGLSVGRVHRCLRHINSDETPFSRVDYGVKTAKLGPYAGQTVRGWWPQRVAAYQEVMNQADDHSARVERGIRRSRLARLEWARGLGTKRALAVVEAVEKRLGLQVEEMSEADLSAFEELLAERIE